MSEWISVKDRLPPKDGSWILVVTVFESYAAIHWCDGWGGEGFYDHTDEYGCDEENMVIWMPLPELPSVIKHTYSEIGTATGFRWLKADGSVGHLKAGETMPLPEPPEC